MLKAFNKVKTALFLLTLVFSVQFNALHASNTSFVANFPNELAEAYETMENVDPIPSATEANIAAEEPGLFDIDPWIFISQTLNFFVLLYVLNRFLFKPMGVIITKRQEEIRNVKTNIQQELEAAEILKKQYEEDLEKIEETAYNIRQRAILEANKKSETIIEEARAKANKIIEEGEMDVFMERQTAWAQIREDVIELTMLSTERIVEESLDEELHRRIIANSIKRFANDLPDFKK